MYDARSLELFVHGCGSFCRKQKQNEGEHVKEAESSWVAANQPTCSA